MSTVASLSAGLLTLGVEMHHGGPSAWFAASLQRTHYDALPVWHDAGISFLTAIMPVALASAGAYITVALFQTGFLLHPESLLPDLSRISPLSGIKRLFSPQTLITALKAIAKLGVLGWLLWLAIKRILPLLPSAPYFQPETMLRLMLAHGQKLILFLLGAQAVIAGADVFWERTRHIRDMRMTLQEVKDEHKDTEGNPLVKQRLRQLGRQRARQRMMQAVPTATVVITNPTHFAVALVYEKGGSGAPRLVAKGADEVAQRIRDIAREHRVPTVANAPLARALYRIEVDTEIPAEHFRAVAEIIAYIWKLRARPGR